MQTIQYDTDQYHSIMALGLGAGFSYNAFYQTIDDVFRHMKEKNVPPSKEELSVVREMYAAAQACDEAFLEAIEGVSFVGDNGHGELMKQTVEIIRLRDAEIMRLLDKHYPSNYTLH